MKYKMMHCYAKNSKLIAIIDINAISEITCHQDGMYIYWRKKVDDCGEIKTERAGCIICDWTKIYKLVSNAVKYHKNKGTKIIFEDDKVYDVCPDFELIE